MNDSILDEPILEETEPMTSDEMVAQVLQDIVLDSRPDELADDFINEFVLRERPETSQILSLFEIPSETLVEALKGIAGQGYQLQIDALNSRGVGFVERLKAEIKERMTELANGPA